MSSYTNNISYGDLIACITEIIQPQNILEIGILDGYSLDHFIKGSPKGTQIQAFDIFDEFNGNCANKQQLREKFKDAKQVSIEYGDFYELYKTIDPLSMDIIHIDIAGVI